MNDNKWEELSGDLLRKIEEKLKFYVDKVQLYCVCKSWQFKLCSLSPSPSRFSLPVLLFPSRLDGASHKFFDFADNTSYYLDLCKSHKFGGALYFYGSSHGWVVANACELEGGGSSVFMFNPLTRLKKQIPATLNSAKCILKCVVSSNSTLMDDYLVVAIIADDPMSLAYIKCGDNKWNEIPCTRYFIDIIFYKGRLYGLTYDKQLIFVEIGYSNPQVFQISTPRLGYTWNELHLVNSRVGLLMVQCIEHKRTTTRFDVCLYDFEAGRWINNLTNIGDNMLFVGHKNSVSKSLQDYCSTPIGFRANKLYFYDYQRNVCERVIHMRVFDLKTKKIEELPDFHYSSTIAPLWLTPITY